MNNSRKRAYERRIFESVIRADSSGKISLYYVVLFTLGLVLCTYCVISDEADRIDVIPGALLCAYGDYIFIKSYLETRSFRKEGRKDRETR